MQFIRRDLDDVLDELPIPFRVRREIEIVLDQAGSPTSLWRTMHQVLDAYMPHPALRHRVERIFDRALAYASNRYMDVDLRNGLMNDSWFRGTFGTGFDTFNRGLDNTFYNRGWFGDTFNGRGWFGDTFNNRGWFGDTFNRGFGDTFGFGNWATDGYFRPGFRTFGGVMRNDFAGIIPVDVVERDHDILVRAALPGVREIDVDTRITHNDILTIRAQRRDGAFLTRTVPLPHIIDTTRTQAFFHDGVLEVSVPKLDATRFHRVPVGRDVSGFRTNGIGDRAYVS